MSSSSTISNLQQALNCAGKCDCCNNLQRQLNKLNDRINTLENKLNNRTNPNNPIDLSAIYKRLNKIEKDVEALKIGIIQTLYNFADIEEVNREFTQAFQALYDMFIPVVEFVGGMFGFLGEE